MLPSYSLYQSLIFVFLTLLFLLDILLEKVNLYHVRIIYMSKEIRDMLDCLC